MKKKTFTVVIAAALIFGAVGITKAPSKQVAIDTQPWGIKIVTSGIQTSPLISNQVAIDTQPW